VNQANLYALFVEKIHQIVSYNLGIDLAIQTGNINNMLDMAIGTSDSHFMYRAIVYRQQPETIEIQFVVCLGHAAHGASRCDAKPLVYALGTKDVMTRETFGIIWLRQTN
jgi:hypothetical protein